MKKIRFIPVIAAIVIGLTSCSTWFENRIPMDISRPSGSLGDLIAPGGKIEKLDAPAQMFASLSNYGNKIILSWTPVADALSYCVEYAVSVKDENGNYPVPDDSLYNTLPYAKKWAKTTYEHVILKDPKYSDKEYEYKYFYRVCADNGEKGYKSSDFTYSKAGSLLCPPKSVTASLGAYKDRIEVKWSSVEGARSYEIYRADNSDGLNAKRVATVPSNEISFINYVTNAEKGKDFYYFVYSVSAVGKSCVSSLALGYSLLDNACSAVSGVTVVNGDGKSTSEINISWNLINDYDDGDVEYAVYRSSSVDSTRVLLAEVGSDISTYCDTTVKPGVYYYYQIQGFVEKTDSNGKTTRIKGPFSSSDADSDTPAEGYLLSAPAKAKVSMYKDDKSKCSVFFTASLASPLCNTPSKVANNKDYSYKLFSSNDRYAAYDEVGTYTSTELESMYNESVKMYEIQNIDTKNFYYIQAICDGNTSEPGDIFASAPLEVRNVVATKAAFIEGLTDSDTKANEYGVFSTVLTWEPSAANDADGGYRIFRSEKRDSGWRKIADVEKTTLQFVDDCKDTNATAKPGVVYYYRILSLNADMEGDNYSEPVAGYGALTAEAYMKKYNETVKKSHSRLTLMHKGGLSKLGTETANAAISGNLYYNAAAVGTSGDVTMKYTDYAEFWIDENNKSDQYKGGDKPDGLGPVFILNGNSNTFSGLDKGTMNGTVTCTGMYPGAVGYDDIKIVSQACGGGTYKISRQGFPDVSVDWTVGED